MKRRAGRFSIAERYLIEESIMKAIMKDVVIVRAEHDYLTRYINYSALSSKFDELEEGEFIPEYTPIIKVINIGTKKQPNLKKEVFEGWERVP